MTDDLKDKPGCLGLLETLLRRWAHSGEPEPAFHYTPQHRLLTPAEEQFYRVLVQAAPGGAAVFAKVRLADVFKVNMSGKGYYTQFNRIAMKHVDFLLCDRPTLRPLLGIELDDKTHGRSARHQRDRDVERIFGAARLPLVRVPAARRYDAAGIAHRIETALQ